MSNVLFTAMQLGNIREIWASWIDTPPLSLLSVVEGPRVHEEQFVATCVGLDARQQFFGQDLRFGLGSKKQKPACWVDEEATRPLLPTMN